MTFAALEADHKTGNPVSLFLFVYGEGANDFYAYTNAEQDITFDDGDEVRGEIVYSAIPITHGKIESSGTLDKANLSVSMVESASITDLVRFRPPSAIISLIIRQGHFNDPDQQFLVKWSGRVLNFAIDGQSNEVTFSCEPIATMLKRNGLRRNYQYACTHPLFGTGCNANKVAASHTAAVMGKSGPQIALSPTWTTTPPPERFLGGTAEWSLPDGRKEYRTIIKVESSGVITLTGSVAGLDPGETVTMVLGCRHTMEDCSALFNNIQNFGGCPYIPLKNPIGLRNNYY